MPPVNINKRKPVKRKQASSGFLFWVAFALFVLLLFFVNRDKIANALRSLNESSSAARGDAAEAAPDLAAQAQEAVPVSESRTSITEIIAPNEAELPVAAPPPAQEDEAPYFPIANSPIDITYSDFIDAVEYEVPDITEIAAPQAGDAEMPVPVQASGQPLHYASESPYEGAGGTSGDGKRAPTRQQRLYFVSIDREGRVLREEVLKDIPRSDSPLADALTALFAGPSDSDTRRGLRSLIPEGTRLLSASIREDGVANINVSEEFRFTQFGTESAIKQLEQVVFTATTFPTVNAVQILIEGQRLEYLGAEGVWIGTPLSRKEFFN